MSRNFFSQQRTRDEVLAHEELLAARLGAFCERHSLHMDWKPHLEYLAIRDIESGDTIYTGSCADPEVVIPKLMEVWDG